MSENLQGKKIGFALTGSYCTLDIAVTMMAHLRELGAEIVPILSPAIEQHDSRFGEATVWQQKIIIASGNPKIFSSLNDAEPIGPQALLDLLLIAPCTGNTLAKMASSITDTAVLMAAKSQLRNQRPVLLAIATNDGLGGNAKNIGLLLNMKNIYFVPFSQDDAINKPNSLVADMQQIPTAITAALAGRQLQPLLI